MFALSLMQALCLAFLGLGALLTADANPTEMTVEDCDVISGAGCNVRELSFVQSWSSKTPEQRAYEIARLSAINNGDANLNAKTIRWAQDRVSLLTALGAAETTREGL